MPKTLMRLRMPIEAGYSSVMFDGSSLPFKENIEKTRLVVEFAHARGVSVEGELGTIGGTEEGISVSEEDKEYTRPCRCCHFCKRNRSGCISSGNWHKPWSI